MNKKGFTLIELVIVIAVLAILAGLAVVTYSLITKRADRRVCETNMVNMENVYQATIYLAPPLSRNVYFENLGDYFDDATCPSDGSYYLEDEIFYCIVHGAASLEEE
jgi:prepilin-type N-terminal cleavage/methylation domain-containing protein